MATLCVPETLEWAGWTHSPVVGAVNARLLLHLLTTCPERRGNQAGFSMVAGIDEIIATWNKPQNRKRLVSGQAFQQCLGSAVGRRALNLRRKGLFRLGLVGQFCMEGDSTDTVRVRSKVVV